jgi:hypothetical protein
VEVFYVHGRLDFDTGVDNVEKGLDHGRDLRRLLEVEDHICRSLPAVSDKVRRLRLEPIHQLSERFAHRPALDRLFPSLDVDKGFEQNPRSTSSLAWLPVSTAETDHTSRGMASRFERGESDQGPRSLRGPCRVWGGQLALSARRPLHFGGSSHGRNLA